MAKCVDNNISICFLTPNGRFKARVIGENNGNVLLRKKQYKISMNEEESLKIAKNFIIGKIYNEKWTIERYIREYSFRIQKEKLEVISKKLSEYIKSSDECTSLDELRGFEGKAQVTYFQVFD